MSLFRFLVPRGPETPPAGGGGDSGGGNDGGGGSSSPIAFGHASYSHTAFGAQPTGAVAAWFSARYDTFVNGDPTWILGNNPNARMWLYALHHCCIFTSQQWLGSAWKDPLLDLGYASIWFDYPRQWAAANGADEEKVWLHAAAGVKHNVAGIVGIDTNGVLTLGANKDGRQVFTKNYAVGATYTIDNVQDGSGNQHPDYNGPCTITAILSQTTLQIDKTSATAGVGVKDSSNHYTKSTLYLTGDGSITKANRIIKPSWDDGKWLLNPGSAEGKAFSVWRYAQLLASGPALKGMMWDSHIVEGTAFAASGDTVEYPQQTTLVDDFCTLLQLYRTTYPGTVDLPNISAYQSDADTKFADAAGGCTRETGLQVFAYDGLRLVRPYVLARRDVGDFVLNQASNMMDKNGVISSQPAAFVTAGGHLYPTANERAAMMVITAYLLWVDTRDANGQHRVMLDPANEDWSNFSNYTARWFGAWSYDIGDPVADDYQDPVWVNGVKDVGGFPVRLWRRDFSRDGGATLSAIVLHREHVSYAPVPPYDAGSEYVYQLPPAPAGKQWYLLQSGGAPEATARTTVPLWFSDAAIVVAL